MPKNSKHCAISKGRTGFNFKELHKWIDEDESNSGINHRKKRHYYNTKDEKQIRDYWNKQGRIKGFKNLGDKAVVEWLFHIALDNLETAMKEGKKTYKKLHNFFRFGWDENGYIFFDSDKLNNEDLEEEFGNIYE